MLLVRAAADDCLRELFSERQWRRLAEHFGLSARQRAIARLMCRGLKRQAIALELAISVNTVRTHVRGLFRRLDVDSRLGLVVRLVLAEREGGEGAKGRRDGGAEGRRDGGRLTPKCELLCGGRSRTVGLWRRTSGIMCFPSPGLQSAGRALGPAADGVCRGGAGSCGERITRSPGPGVLESGSLERRRR